VVIEAMSNGLAMIVADRGGPGEAVGEAGVRVPVTEPDRFARDIAAAIAVYLRDPGLAAAHGEKARRRAGEWFVWDRKIERLERIYEQIAMGSAAWKTDDAGTGAGRA
jgi:glycosyltransferase involved in cell wall biosynthesis